MNLAKDVAVSVVTSLLVLASLPLKTLADPTPPANLCLKTNSSECNPSHISPPIEPITTAATTSPEVVSTTSNGKKHHPGYYLMVSRPDPEELDRVHDSPAYMGIMKNIAWKTIEKKENVYDWSDIERDLKIMSKKNKQIGYQLMTTSFNNKNGAGFAPDYLLKNPIYGGGLVQDKNNRRVSTKPIAIHNAAVSLRLNKLVAEFAKRFDNHPNFEVLIFQETSYPVYCKSSTSEFTHEKYWQAMTSRLDTAKQYFKKTNVVQRVNYWPCPGPEGQKYYTDKIIRYAASLGIGHGQPDIRFRKGNILDSIFPLHEEYSRTRPDLARGASIQWDNYEHASVEKMFDFVRDKLKVSYFTILPRNGDPKTKQPNWYTDQVLPYLKKHPRL